MFKKWTSRQVLLFFKRKARNVRLLMLMTAILFILTTTTVLTTNDDVGFPLSQVRQRHSRKIKQTAGASTKSIHTNRAITHWRQMFPDRYIFRRYMSVPQALRVKYLLDRVKHARKKCSEGWKPEDEDFFGFKILLHFDEDLRMNYCPTAKAGSTFWGQVFGFITRREKMAKLGIKSPFEIEKMKIHTGILGPALKQQWPEFHDDTMTKRTLRFMFARNPYSRLWAVFLDKFFLLGEWEGRSRSDFWCVDFDSFDSFLERALTSSDHHVMPITELCNPCLFEPHVIGHLETFEQDVEFILNQTLYWPVLRSYNYRNRIQGEMKSVIASNFGIFYAVRHERDVCLDEKTLCQRLWTVFQLNGYISKRIDFPHRRRDYSQSTMTAVFLEAAQKSFLTEEEAKQQKRDSLIQAYQNISSSLISVIQTRYRVDFAMFDYDTTPPSLRSSGL